MFNKKVLIAGIASIAILGGAIGVGAATNGKTGAVDKTNIVEKNEPTIISIEKAAEVAMATIEGKGMVESIELERENGRRTYEVDVIKDGIGEIEVEIDAVTGEIIKVDEDDDDVVVDDSNHKAIISMEEAIAIAKKETTGRVTDVELELDDGYYEIEIENGKKEVEMKISVTDGNILKKEVDDEDYDD